MLPDALGLPKRLISATPLCCHLAMLTLFLRESTRLRATLLSGE